MYDPNKKMAKPTRIHVRACQVAESLLALVLGLVGAIGICLVAGPQCQVVAEQLHNEGGVLVGFLVQCVELGNGIVERLLGDLARTVWGVEDLVVEDGEVEGQTETDWVCWWEVGGGDSAGGLVGIEGGAGGLLSCVSGLELGEVSVVVALHLVVEDLGLLGGGVWNEGLLDDSEDVVADLDELGLDLGLVVLDDLHLLSISLLLDAGDNAPGGTARSDDVLVGNGEEVALLNG
mmetsp:Transcript_16256/g.45061  ORF Transcript_16256/g.45061 Transcript_16256/m.45061 type:complete len:234 (+) Transcript_16256:1611-2312(+)